MIKHVLLDIDDTILDFKKAEAIAIRKTFSTMGIPVDDALIARYSEINQRQWERLERGELTREQVLVERFNILFEEIGVKAPAEMAQATYEYLLGIGHYFIEGAPELLESLYGKYDLYVVSNGTANVQDRRLKSADIVRYFKGIFISERVGYNKPSREFFDTAFAGEKDFDRSCAILVGDSLTSDILGGINAGVKTCWFNPNNKAPRADIVPDYEIKSLSELPELLEKI